MGLLEVVPQVMGWRPPAFAARNQLEGLLSSDSAADWVALTEKLLGPAPAGFRFEPKHKSNAYAANADTLAQLAAASAGCDAGAGQVDDDDDGGQENG